MNKTKLYMIDVLLALGVIGLDQYTKYLAKTFLMNKEPILLIPHCLELRYLENRGAAFGIMQNQKLFFCLITFVILAAVLYGIIRMPYRRPYRLLHIMAALLCGGAIGNLIDRVSYNYVVDFIYFSLIDFPIFNVADIFVSCISVGAILLIFFGKFGEHDFDFLNPFHKAVK